MPSRGQRVGKSTLFSFVPFPKMDGGQEIKMAPEVF